MVSEPTWEDFGIPNYRTLALPGFWGNYSNDSSNRKEGMCIATDKNHFRIMVGNEFNPYLYRGENKKYDYFIPSGKRECSNSNKCIEWIKKEQFKDAIMKTPYFTYLKDIELPQFKLKFQFDLEALAQHYGFMTNYLDVTRNVNVAEFFAYTWQDKEGKYHPIEDFGSDNYEPMLYKARVDDVINYDKNIFQIVGFQVAKRTLRQYAMALDLSNNDKDIKNAVFKPTKLPWDRKRAIKIFEKYEGGEKLFPKEALVLIAEELRKPKTYISNQYLIRCQKEFNIPYHKIKSLIHNNSQIKLKEKILIPPKNVQELMAKDLPEIQKWINSNVCCKLATVLCEDGFNPYIW